MRFAWVVLVAACWSRSPKPAVEAPAIEETETETNRAPEQPICTMETFDPSSSACEGVCTQTAPQGWPGCTKLADDLIAQGYTCLRPTPFACQPPFWMKPVCPASGCVPIRARVIAISVVANGVLVKFSAGRSRGITPAWTAKLVDANGRPVPNGVIKLLSVDKTVTTGSIVGLSDPTLAAVFVLVTP